jgi:hypothetical protein
LIQEGVEVSERGELDLKRYLWEKISAKKRPAADKPHLFM